MKTTELTTTVMTITPEQSAEWLTTRNVKNRTILPARVTEYARQMRLGLWPRNGQPIIFDWDGHLMDGQHRLAACVKANTHFESDVTFGVDPAVFGTLDRGRPRNLKTILYLEGYGEHENLAGLVSMLWREEQGLDPTQRHTAPNSEEAKDFIRRHPGLESYCPVPASVMKVYRSKLLPAYFQYRFTKIDPVAKEGFFQVLASGGDTSTGNPPAVLRDKLLMYAFKLEKLDEKSKMALTIKAWNAFCKGQSVYQLNWRGYPTAANPKPELFPVIR